jgi:dihydrofolate synthase/folylpolyglutamate synthase
VSLTYFEFGTLAALWLMERAQLDVAVLEVGLGGRLDAVNAVDADVAVLTSIDIDHEEWLGADRESIGREKAGIFRAKRPAICGDPAPPASVPKAARECKAELLLLGRHFKFARKAKGWNWQGLSRRYAALPLPALAGAFQLRNAACALAAIEQLSRTHVIGEGDVRAGLLTANLAGRFQRIADDAAEWIFDVGHNAEAAGALAAELAAAPVRGRTVALIGMMRDKRVEEYARRLAPYVNAWMAVGLPPPRGLGDEELATRLEQALAVKVERAGTVAEACARAAALAGPRDRIVVCGSFHTIGPALEARGYTRDPAENTPSLRVAERGPAEIFGVSMNRRFKERLIGAIVLVGAAVVILPAVLNGPRPPSAETPEPPAAESALRSETIQLDTPPATPPVSSAAPQAAESSSAPADAPATAAAGPAVDGSANDAAATGTAAQHEAPGSPAAATSAPASTAPARESTPPPRDAATTEHKPASATVASTSPPAQPAKPAAKSVSAPASSGWAVQVGNFATQSNAEALTASLKARGYAAFISPRVAGDKTYFRVRVGPTQDIEAARALEQRLEKDGQAGDVVRHP